MCAALEYEGAVNPTVAAPEAEEEAVPMVGVPGVETANAGAADRATPAIVKTKVSRRKSGDRAVRSRQLNLPRFDDNSTSHI